MDFGGAMRVTGAAGGDREGRDVVRRQELIIATRVPGALSYSCFLEENSKLWGQWSMEKGWMISD